MPQAPNESPYLRVRLTVAQKRRLLKEAKRSGISTTELVKRWIDSLPANGERQ